ncbi:GTP pyrophosphokinase [Pseudoxanthomonas sp. GM95]|uniref:RelA/SpoT family protein n=1 Tax=Pseudoxanthomonas sp. GM95 TaxID=1881043 RepID=UPI0008B8C44A|nr:bifunctional (p)ppGpp synthetase/guanosine-3',5'-bis(diphosphate) 3'-pyrophosphohydrolase [Pseudoxanthomonas sp. GM95]SEL66546.1 GTP pyrophosphokinase [Pseudoxanthomonas sp. GM95]
MSATSSPLPAVVQSVLAGLPQALRTTTQAALGLPDAQTGMPDAWPVLEDTLATLTGLSADAEVLGAALLSGLPAIQPGLMPQLRREAPGMATLMDGQAAAAQVWALHAEPGAARNTEGLRRLLLAMIQDLRVVPILLARQLARMRAASHLDAAQRRELALLTRDIHAPLANRLGIWQLKWELEDLAFRHLQPDTYRSIATQLDDKRAARERYIEKVKATLRATLTEHRIAAEVSGRPKHIYSIWKKMQRKQVALDELFDLRAVRIAVSDVAQCYAALGVVHALWTPIPSEFDDYIARPKANDYRSLHTAVVGPEGRALEVQIRTHDMHAQAELGVAAHWRYKEGGGDAAFDRKIAWMRRLLEHGHDGEGEAVLGGALDAELAEDRIYTLTPKGEVIDLPRGGTVLDFAYHVHTMVGHRTRGAKVNGRIVPLGHVLHSGDRVEILTNKTGEPKRDWLQASSGFLASARSRDKVRAYFHKLDRAGNIAAGKDLLERELKRLHLHQLELAPALKKFRAETAEELYIQVALGDTGPSQVARALQEDQRAQAGDTPLPLQNATRRPVQRAPGADKSRFTVQGVGNLLVQLAKCCQPVAGEPIVGYLTRGRGVTVHRRDCAALRRLSAQHPQRVLPVEWGVAGGGYEVDALINAIDRKWLLKDITTLIAQEDAHVLDIHSDAAGSPGKIRFKLRLKVSDYGQLSTLLGKLDALPGVQDARRAG